MGAFGMVPIARRLLISGKLLHMTILNPPLAGIKGSLIRHYQRSWTSMVGSFTYISRVVQHFALAIRKECSSSGRQMLAGLGKTDTESGREMARNHLWRSSAQP